MFLAVLFLYNQLNILNCLKRSGMDLLVKLLVKALCPLIVPFWTVAATDMLYCDPGVRSGMVTEVLKILSNMESLWFHLTQYDSALPNSGSSQLKDIDVVVTSVTVSFSTTAGSKNEGHTKTQRWRQQAPYVIWFSTKNNSTAWKRILSAVPSAIIQF